MGYFWDSLFIVEIDSCFVMLLLLHLIAVMVVDPQWIVVFYHVDPQWIVVFYHVYHWKRLNLNMLVLDLWL